MAVELEPGKIERRKMRRRLRVSRKAGRDALRLSPITLIKSRKASAFFPAFKARLRRLFDRFVRAAAKNVRDGFEPFPSGLAQWEQMLRLAKQDFVVPMAADGWRLAEAEIETIESPFEFAKAIPEAPGLVAVDVPTDPADFLIKADTENIAAYLEQTAAAETKTNAKRIDKIIRDAAAKETTPSEIAKEIIRKGLAMSSSRADMIARTAITWSYNEGAQIRYASAGITAQQWLATIDDVTCPFCSAMDGKTVRTNDPFLPGGTPFTVENSSIASGKLPGADLVTLGGQLNDVKHPPLHPNCRCTLIPVL